MIEQTVNRPDAMPETMTSRRTPSAAVRSYWYLVVLCAVLAAGCGAVYAFKRTPSYTASARLSTVSVNTSNSASLAGSLESAQALASTFARVTQTSHVVDAVAAALHTTPAWVAQHVTGTPIPSSPFVRIDADASRPEIAMTAANVALTALTTYARRLIGPPSGDALLATVRADAVRLSAAQAVLGHLKGKALGGTPSPDLQSKIDRATADAAVAQTRLSGAQLAYTQQAGTQSSERQQIASSRALTATSDRRQTAEIAILLGLLVGAVLGVAAAMALGTRATAPAV